MNRTNKETPLIGLSMPQLAYASLVWSLQDFSPEDFINALVAQKSKVFEQYSEVTEVVNLPLQEILRLQEELRLLHPSQIIDMQLAFGHFFVVLFGTENHG